MYFRGVLEAELYSIALLAGETDNEQIGGAGRRPRMYLCSANSIVEEIFSSNNTERVRRIYMLNRVLHLAGLENGRFKRTRTMNWALNHPLCESSRLLWDASVQEVSALCVLSSIHLKWT